jgi:stage II sporulation protein D
MFRNATGEPGWVAASTRGNRIRMQPGKVLGTRVESTLRHEMIHLLLDARTASQTPLWFREGVAMLLSGDVPNATPTLPPQRMESILSRRGDDQQMQAAYRSALATVARLEHEVGRDTLLRWLRGGIPSGVLSDAEHQIRAQDTAERR